MLGLDKFTPHEHENEGPCGPGCERIGRVWLFFLAIALHNLPEGMAIGVSFADNDLSVGMPLTMAILFQNVPEGLAVALALRAAMLSPVMAAIVASGTGLMELLGAFLGIGIAGGLPLAYPVGLGLAAGAMIFVVSHEVIPETHRNGHQTPATLGLMGGFRCPCWCWIPYWDRRTGPGCLCSEVEPGLGLSFGWRFTEHFSVFS